MTSPHHPQRATPQARALSRYLWGAAVVWAAIWIATAVVLKGGGTFADMIPILAIGTGWFLAVVPQQLASRREGSEHE